jgi:hypothetical protein
MHTASRFRRYRVLQYLLQRGARAYVVDAAGHCPLHALFRPVTHVEASGLHRQHDHCLCIDRPADVRTWMQLVFALNPHAAGASVACRYTFNCPDCDSPSKLAISACVRCSLVWERLIDGSYERCAADYRVDRQGRCECGELAGRLFWIAYMLHCFVISAVLVPDLVRCPSKDGQVLGLLKCSDGAGGGDAAQAGGHQPAPKLTLADLPKDARLRIAEEVMPGVSALLLSRPPAVAEPSRNP